MKSHIWLLEAVLRDSAMQCSVPHHEWHRDLITATRRFEDEGYGFLAITLPALDDALLEGFREGRWPTASVTSFKTDKGGLPRFLGGFLRLVFDADGKMLDNPSVASIACLRQIFNLFKKVEIPCSTTRVRKTLRKFIETDRDIPDPPLRFERHIGDQLGTNHVDRLRATFRCLFVKHLLPLDRKIFEGEALNAKHGPGATADRLRHNRKYQCSDWTARLNSVFSSDLYTQSFESRDLREEEPCAESSYVPIQEEQEQPVRVITVPKTQKGPRVIAIEPTVMQYMQQGLLDGIVKGLAGTRVGNSLNFNDQSKNGQAALLSSKDGRKSTLDLSEASDRVPNWIVEALVRPGLPHLWGALDATRSRIANVRIPTSSCNRKKLQADNRVTRLRPRRDTGRWAPGAKAGRISGPNFQEDCPDIDNNDSGWPRNAGPESHFVRLRKFASMGSAVCFPVEAMVFITIVVAAIAECRGLSINRRTTSKILDDVLVFGDDIIVPTDCAPYVTVWLEAVGLKVNRRKSFWTGKFRESCGVDAFDGQDVTPAYLRSISFGDDGSDWIHQWVSFSNQLYMRGFWETARAVREKLDIIVGPIPMVAGTSPAIGYTNVRGTYTVQRWDNNLHKFLVKAYCRRPVRESSPLDGIAALRKCLTTSFNEDPEHLLRATRSSSVSTKKRWTSPY